MSIGLATLALLSAPRERPTSGPPIRPGNADAIAGEQVTVSGEVVRRFGSHVIQITGGDAARRLLVVLERPSDADVGDTVQATGTVGRIEGPRVETRGETLPSDLTRTDRETLYAVRLTTIE